MVLEHPNLPRKRIERIIRLILTGRLRRNAGEFVEALAKNPAVTAEDLAPLCILDDRRVAEVAKEGIRRRLGGIA